MVGSLLATTPENSIMWLTGDRNTVEINLHDEDRSKSKDRRDWEEEEVACLAGVCPPNLHAGNLTSNVVTLGEPLRVEYHPQKRVI